MSNHLSYNEQELLEQMAAGSEAAFSVLFHSYRDKLYNYILKISRSGETAEDAVHEIFLQLWQRREQLPAIDNLSAYLFRAARNRSVDLFRRMARERLVLAAIADEGTAHDGASADDDLHYRDITAFVREAVEKLSPQQKRIFLLSRQEGLKLAEIADRLSISERTVKNHMTEALRILRGEISGRYGTDAVIIFVLFQLTTG